jgi:hypothetical protein
MKRAIFMCHYVSTRVVELDCVVEQRHPTPAARSNSGVVRLNQHGRTPIKVVLTTMTGKAKNRTSICRKNTAVQPEICTPIYRHLPLVPNGLKRRIHRCVHVQLGVQIIAGYFWKFGCFTGRCHQRQTVTRRCAVRQRHQWAAVGVSGCGRR